ncbi:hypothetical protein [Butyrivibrio sp. AE2032]|uniref:hypothetical protein n=1 Tax=Butyrivibrio sp. AE2032 TaxID=1458463 RepID=UPI0005526BB8|nr:hypothetical protein [Butyrivibrio sp. AE2032]
MKSVGFGKKLAATGLIAAVLLTGAACTDKLHTDPTEPQQTVQQTVDPMSFQVIDAKIRDYTFGLNEYMKEHGSEAKSKKVSGATLSGVAAAGTYTVSPDGKYEALQLEKKLPDGMQMDEYFNMGDALFIARTTIYDDGNFDPVDKYYITDGVVYKVDGSAETVTKIIELSDSAADAKKLELDLYFTFEEIRALYA